MKARSAEEIRVLHVDDDPEFVEMTTTFLEREDERLDVDAAMGASDGLDILDMGAIDCVVSDFDMPGSNGIEFLETVRERDPDLPFILFTGKGSEEVAGEAITAGVTDYLQKRGGQEQYAVLANRIVNAVERARAERERTRHLDAIETAQEGIGILDPDGRFIYVNDAFATLYGYDPHEMVGEHWELIYRDEDVSDIRDDVLPFVEETGYWHGTTTGMRADGSTFVEDHVLSSTDRGELIFTVRDITELRQQKTHLDILARRYDAIFENPLSLIALLNAEGMVLEVNPNAMELIPDELDDILGEPFWETPWWTDSAELQADLEGWIERAVDGEHVRFESNHPGQNEPVTVDGLIHPILDDTGAVAELLVIGRDVTERKERQRELRRERDRLDDFTSIVSHDLRSPLTVASGRLNLAMNECDSEHLHSIERAHERIDELLEDLLTLARSGAQVTDVESVALDDIATKCWRTVGTEGARLETAFDERVRCDTGQLKQLLENLFRNAIEHTDVDVTVRLGSLTDEDGFYIADDGPGIPPEDRDRVFDGGYSTSEQGTGLGLRIAERTAEAHGWGIRITESQSGGAQFEITDVDIVDPPDEPSST